LALAEADLNRFDGLRTRGFVTEAELARQKTAVESARARLKAAEASQSESNRQVGYTTLIADSAGVVTALDFNVGQVVAAGQPVLRLARPGEREIEIHVPEGELARIKSAKAFEITLNARPNQSYPGTLRELAAAADPATRTYAARIMVNAAQDALNLNMSATVRMIQNSTQTIRLPLSAVFTRDGVPRVWKLDTVTSTVRAAVVTTGAVNSNDWQIDSGLNRGEGQWARGSRQFPSGRYNLVMTTVFEYPFSFMGEEAASIVLAANPALTSLRLCTVFVRVLYLFVGCGVLWYDGDAALLLPLPH
jgi:RND family efflux transporter MFP subunit